MTDNIPTDDVGEFPLPNHHYDAPVDAIHRANRLGLDGHYHVRRIDGDVRYVPGSNLAQLRNHIDEEPKTNLETSKYAEYGAGDKVTVDGEDGMVLELHTSNFDFGEDEYEASQDNVVYVVGTGEGTVIATEDELSSADWETDVPADPETVAEELEPAENYNAIEDDTTTEVVVNEILDQIEGPDAGTGFDRYPPSWDKSEKPNRLILMDAWFSMGGTFRGCRKELKSARLCAAFKDEVWGTTYWRDG